MVREGMWERRRLILISGLLGDRRVWAKVEKPGLERTANCGWKGERERESSQLPLPGGMEPVLPV